MAKAESSRKLEDDDGVQSHTETMVEFANPSTAERVWFRPNPGSFGCWVVAWTEVKHLAPNQCSNRARPGRLTCGVHKHLERQAREYKEKDGQKHELAPKRTERGRPTKLIRYKHGKNYRRIKDEIIQIQRRINDRFDEEHMDAAIVLFAALEVGQETDTIYRFLGYNVPKVSIQWMKIRLEKNGVWKNGKTYCSWMEEHGYLAFICDVLVACNVLQRV